MNNRNYPESQTRSTEEKCYSFKIWEEEGKQHTGFYNELDARIIYKYMVEDKLVFECQKYENDQVIEIVKF